MPTPGEHPNFEKCSKQSAANPDTPIGAKGFLGRFREAGEEGAAAERLRFIGSCM